MMTSNLLEEFKKILNESDWMDGNSRDLAIEKVCLFKICLAKSYLLSFYL